MFVTPAYAQAAGGGSAIASFVPLILIFAIMYFLLIRPQQKKVKEHKAMVEALRRGDQIVTQGGLIGKVTKVVDDNRPIQVYSSSNLYWKYCLDDWTDSDKWQWVDINKYLDPYLFLS